jgi:hypothetical protein
MRKVPNSDQNGLYLLKEVLRFVQVQAERVDGQHVTIDLRHSCTAGVRSSLSSASDSMTTCTLSFMPHALF